MALEPPPPSRSPSLVSDNTTDLESLDIPAHLSLIPDNHSCGICSKAYINPRLLPCLHSFCLECIKNQSQESEGNLSMACPTCKRVMDIPGNDPALLHSDLHLTDSIHVLELLQKVTSTPAPSCDWCENDAVSMAYCYNCHKFLCSNCHTLHCQVLTKLYKGHTILLLESLLELDRAEAVRELEKNIPSLSKCVEHEGEELKFHCNQCFKPVCDRCIVTQHQEHKYCHTTEDIIGGKKDEVCSKVAEFGSSHDKVKNTVFQIKKVKSDVASNKETIASELNAAFTAVYEQLNVRHRQLLEETKDIASNKMEKLTSQQTTLEVVTKSSDYCKAFASRACHEYNNVQFLSVAKPISNRASALQEELKTAPIEICETADISLVLDTDALKKGINSFGCVTDIAPCPSQCSSIIPCRVLARETEMQIQVISRNQQGYRIAKGDSVVKGFLHSKDGLTILEFNGEDQGNGLYNLSISAPDTGKYMLYLTINGHEIHRSPLSIRIVPIHEYRTFGASLPRISVSVNQPHGITFTSNGSMYVSSKGDKCIYIFDSRDGAPKETIIKPSLGLPFGIDAYNNRVLYITDNAKNVIKPFVISGRPVEMKAICTDGDNIQELKKPADVRVSPDGKLYISDTGNGCVQVINRNTHEYIHPLTRKDFGKDFEPHGIAFDLKGNVHVAGGDKSTMICLFAPDGSFIGQYDCGIPASDIAIDWSGYSLCVGKGSFVVLSPNGEPVHRVDGFGNLSGVGVSPNGSIWITDTKANKVIKMAMNFH